MNAFTRQFQSSHRCLMILSLMIALSSCGGLSERNDPNRVGGSPPSTQEDDASPLWQQFGVDPGEEPGQYESLTAMAEGAHVIIEALVEDVKAGRVFGEGEGSFRSTHLILKVEEVFGGNVNVGDNLTMGLGLAELDVDVAVRYADLANDKGIFFLIPTWAPQPEFGITDYPPEKGLDIYRPVNSQGVFVKHSGAVNAPLYLDDDGFPVQFEGMAFQEFEERVEAAAQAAQAS